MVGRAGLVGMRSGAVQGSLCDAGCGVRAAGEWAWVWVGLRRGGGRSAAGDYGLAKLA